MLNRRNVIAIEENNNDATYHSAELSITDDEIFRVESSFPGLGQTKHVNISTSISLYNSFKRWHPLPLVVE